MLIENLKKQKQQQFYSDLEKKAHDSHVADSEMEDLSQGVCRPINWIQNHMWEIGYPEVNWFKVKKH